MNSIPYRIFVVNFWLLMAITATAQSSLTYPDWFFNPPSAVQTAVGYVYDFTISAYQDGSNRFNGQKRVCISGQRKHYRNNYGLDFNDNIKLKPLATEWDSLWTLSYFLLDHDTIILVGTDSCLINKTIIDAEKIPKPDWVTRLPSAKGYVYGIGSGKFRRGIHHRSWSLTDENAIVNCARSVRLKSSSFLRQTTKGKHTGQEIVISEDINVTLKDVQIIKRWLDYEAMTCFSLARGKVLSPGL
ncbi:MAG: hypothetical protein HQK83_17740 [Fibrobacteria bacterium]|nr:hypothetical protein [Fibrobacteria bacterium]